MSRFPRREEIAGALFAIVLVGGLGYAWTQRRSDEDSGDEPNPTANLPLDAAIPVDDYVTSGTMPNGMRFFVRANDSPGSRAELRLVINAGSVLEADDQLGLAHAVEHMLFRGTRAFPGRAIDDYLQSIGMRAGEDINASTSFDETIVRFTVPTDRPGVIDTALTILAGMAHDATFARGAASQEAGVVFEEWRERLGARSRQADARNDFLLAGSRYAGHPTIGDTGVLRRFDVKAMKRFYEDWYRPEMMAVVAVGDFNPEQVRNLILRRFGNLPKSDTPRTRPSSIVPRGVEPRAAVFTDPETRGTRVTFWFPRRVTPTRFVRDYREATIEGLVRDVITDRLDAIVDAPDSPLLDSDVESRSMARSVDADLVSAGVAGGRVLPAAQTLITELSRLQKHGVSEGALVRYKAALLRQHRDAIEWQDRSIRLADDLVEEFITGATMLSRDREYDLTRSVLPTIRPADILRVARGYSIDRGAAIIVASGNAGLASSLAPAALIANARFATTAPVAASSDSVAGATLRSPLPAAGVIDSQRHLADVRAFDWRLSNGMRVILKPTRFSFDQIELRMNAPGGASLATDADYASAFSSDNILRVNGVGALSGIQLRRLLDETSVSFDATVNDDGIGLVGSAAPRDIEKLFQLVSLYFTAPRADTAAFGRYHDRLIQYAETRDADPETAFDDTVAVTLGQHHPRALTGSLKFAESVRLGTALDFWKARVANASNFTVVLVGDFSNERVRPLVERYLAGLPAGVHEQARDVGMPMPPGVVQRSLTVGVRPKARTRITFGAPLAVTNEENQMLSAVRDVAESALGETLRETLGGTYGVNVELDVRIGPPARYMFSVDFEAAPERIDSLATVALAELERLRTRGPTQAQFERVRAAEIRDLDGRVEQNTYWAKELASHARLGWALGTISTHQESARMLSLGGLKDACAKYLSTKEYVRVTMRGKRQ